MERAPPMSTSYKLSIAAIVLLLVAIVFSGAFYQWFTGGTEIVKITGTERINKGEDSYYLIYAKKEGGGPMELKNTDAWLSCKCDSSTLYNEFQGNVGSCYKVDYYGWRIGCSSTYPNATDYIKVDCPDSLK